MNFRFLFLVIGALGVAGFDANPARAHDLHGIVKLTETGLVIEASFDDETPAQGATVSINSLNGECVFTSKTDDRGICRFDLPGPGHYVAVIELVGHRDTIPFEVAATPGGGQFANWRMNKTAGVTVGVGGLVGVSGLYWLLRRRKPARERVPSS